MILEVEVGALLLRESTLGLVKGERRDHCGMEYENPLIDAKQAAS